MRVGRGTPISAKNLSCPAGEQMQRRRTGCADVFLNWWGAFAGMWSISTALTVIFSPRKVASTSPSNRTKDSSKYDGAAADRLLRDVHVDDAEAIGYCCSWNGDCVCVTYNTDMRQRLVFIKPT